MRPGTLAVIMVLLVAMILFGFFLLSDGERRPAPVGPSPTIGST